MYSLISMPDWLLSQPTTPAPFESFSMLATAAQKKKAIKDDCQAENQVIDNAIKQVQAITESMINSGGTTEAMLDSGATSNFIRSADGFELTATAKGNGQIMRATMTALLPLRQLNADHRITTSTHER
jgi:hypothetical protein